MKPAPANSPTAPRRTVTAERRLKALEMRQRGMRFTEIGPALGISSQAAGQLVRTALNEIAKEITEHADAMRAQESERLDAVSRELYQRALKGDLGAADRYLKYRESYRRLWGLDLRPPDAGTEVNFNIVTAPPWERPGGEVIDGVAEERPALTSPAEGAAGDHPSGD